mmetsp:Transcript_15274/g.22859  ORF Transcript_15274/g.22859 Transcript_15274/m.22859 type:complete len:154 (+) Transcript_15274:341-802(+)
MSKTSVERILIKLTNEKLSLDTAVAFVTDGCCGAISSFIGITRDNFKGKKVLQLEYEAYQTMAEKKMQTLASTTLERWPALHAIAIFHRLGVVPITEASVIIVVSSPHRADALEATQFAIDELKATVPIWKKEIYQDGSSSWKENAECCHKSK